jgi:hypothetical protein
VDWCSEQCRNEVLGGFSKETGKQINLLQPSRILHWS